jgi:demethylmenaquinone methyltransferase/2-methoxy-6-polyprenyl-1,4-benzoquinol methylase
MFDNIAGKYDFLNHFFSLGIDKIWRKKLRKLINIEPKTIIDVASGTGDLAIEFSKILPQPKEIIGIDISEKMLKRGAEKVERKGLEKLISFRTQNVEELEFENNSFDVATVAFGVRNFENLKAGLIEMCRVIKQDGYIYVLEFSKPKYFPVKQLYMFYFKYMVPFFGRIFSKDKSAYRYLFNSVLSFPDDVRFLSILKDVGFVNTKQKRLSFGIVTIYCGQKV